MFFCEIYLFPKSYKIGSRKNKVQNLYKFGLDEGLEKSLTRMSVLLKKIFYTKSSQCNKKFKPKDNKKKGLYLRRAVNVELEYTWKDPILTKKSKNYRFLSWNRDERFSTVTFDEPEHRMTVFISKSFFVKKLDKLKRYINATTRVGKYKVTLFEFNETSDQLIETIYYDLDQISDDLVKNKKGKFFFLDPELKENFKIKWIASLKKGYLNNLYAEIIKKSLFKLTKTTTYSTKLLRFLNNPFDIKFSYSCIMILLFLVVTIRDMFTEIGDHKKR
jgi:hypothetical protein|mmetsp:Transcript_79647/g.129127  ORF Transcript_79647/g.129127 Transcript_79647/m.129127 type:complete len:275 (+) Transcript_79647:407-1231(+)